MTTTNTLQKVLDRKGWEFCTPAPVATAAGMFVSSGRLFRQVQYYYVSSTVQWMYLPEEDAWVELPSAAMGGTAAASAGCCGCCTPMGPTGTATAGTTTTLTTNLTLARDLRGFKIRITGGPGAGDERTIASNTVGANAVITVTSAFSATITTSSTYQLITGRWYVFNANTAVAAAGQCKYYDYALNTWTAVATGPGYATSWGTDGRLVGHPSIVDNADVVFASGTATSGTATTIVNSAKAWASNQWANAYQVRITAGTGAGQVRQITSNTGTALTVATWTTNPDATSQYVIEGNNNYLYLLGNNNVAMYRLDIAANTWSTLAPGVARGAAPGAAVSAHWVWSNTDAGWSSENAILAGRRIYSFRAGGGALVDYYDVPSNAWTNDILYAPKTTTFTTGTKYVILDGRYICAQKDATNRWYRFDPVTQNTDPLAQFLYTQGAAVAGDTAFDVQYRDGATTLTYIHMLLNTSTVNLRMLVI
jgi:hypothetical protein